MYDKFQKCLDYYMLRRLVEKLLNGEPVKFPVSWLKKKIQESFDNGRLQGGQYDHLMGLLQEVDFQ